MPRHPSRTPVRRLTATLLAGLTLSCASLAALAVAPPAGARPAIGIADESVGTLSDPRFAWLGMRMARLVVPWDVARHRDELALVDQYLKTARAHGISPLVVFDHGARHAKQLPSPGAYRSAVVAVLRRYPWVKDYSAWNEENHATEPTARNPQRAAQYFNQLASLCRSCRITAADVLDEPNMRHWVTTFLRFARHPKLWGLHNYFDLNHGGHRQTQLLLSLVPGQVWFTETGGLVWRYDTASRKFVDRGEAYADRAAKRLLGLAALSPRITRIYYYHWRLGVTLAYARKHRGKVTWDSGLFRADCSARPALSVIAGALGKRLARMPKVVRDSSNNCVAPAVKRPPTTGAPPSSGSSPTSGSSPSSGSPPASSSPPPSNPPPPSQSCSVPLVCLPSGP